MTQSRLKIGDIIEIPLPSKKKAYVHFMGKDTWGDLINIFDYTSETKEPFNMEAFRSQKYTFGPILTRIRVGIKSPEHNWRIVGNIKVEKFKRRSFIWKDGGPLSIGKATRWYIYDGVKSEEVGKHLPDTLKSLEYMTNYSPSSVIKRILTNKNPDQKLIAEG